MYPTCRTSNNKQKNPKQYHIIKFYKTINFYSIASSAFPLVSFIMVLLCSLPLTQKNHSQSFHTQKKLHSSSSCS